MSKKKTPPSLNFIIPLEVYPFDVMVSIGQSDEQLGAVLDKLDLSVADIELCRYASTTAIGRAVMFSTNGSFIRLRHLPSSARDFATLAHEIFHIVTFVMDRIGMKLKLLVSDEAYAYLISYLTEKIYDKINKHY